METKTEYDWITCSYCGYLCGENSYMYKTDHYIRNYCSEECAKADLAYIYGDTSINRDLGSYKELLDKVDWNPNSEVVKKMKRIAMKDKFYVKFYLYSYDVKDGSITVEPNEVDNWVGEIIL